MRILTIVSCSVLAAAVLLPAGNVAHAQNAWFRSFVQERRSQPERQQEAAQPMPQQRPMRAADEDERGRMSPEERRQLRQDIQNAGRDIYRPTRQYPMERRRGRRE